jgi:hypothetical protein
MFEINHICWYLPKVTPNLTKLAELESSFASGLNTKLSWESSKVYKPHVKESTDVDVDWRCTTTQQRPSHIFIVFQKASRKNNQYNTNINDCLKKYVISLCIEMR